MLDPGTCKSSSFKVPGAGGALVRFTRPPFPPLQPGRPSGLHERRMGEIDNREEGSARSPHRWHDAPSAADRSTTGLHPVGLESRKRELPPMMTIAGPNSPCTGCSTAGEVMFR